MKVLQINTTAGTGATGRIADAIARGLMADGHTAVIAASRGQSEVEGVERWHIGNQADRVSHFLESRLLDRQGLASRRATALLCGRISADKPDVVHLHNLHGYYLHVPELLRHLAALRLPVVITLHDHWLLTGHCASPHLARCRRWVAGECRDCPLRDSYPRSRADRSARNVALKREALSGIGERLRLVAVSEWMLREAEEAALAPTMLITNGIDIEYFTPAEQPHARRVLAVANVWNTAKGADRLVELRRLLPADVEIAVAGEVRHSALRRQSGITLLGTLPAERVRAQMRDAAVAVSLSRSESWGMAVAEALACGVPVVGFANTATTEMLNACGGFAVADGDVGAVEERIMALLGEPADARAAMSRHSAVTARYDDKEMARLYIELYESLR